MLWHLMRMTRILLVLVMLAAATASAEGPTLEKTHSSYGLFTSVGSGLNGTSANTHLWITGFRYSYGLHKHLTYSAEIIPSFLVFQSNTVYGASIAPFLLGIDLPFGRKLGTYAEFGLGALYSSSEVPERSSTINFTPEGGVGFRFFRGSGRVIRFEARYTHISNGGLVSPNPGINSIQFQVGYDWLH